MKSQIINYWARISDCITFPENITINKEFKIVSAKKKKKKKRLQCQLLPEVPAPTTG